MYYFMLKQNCIIEQNNTSSTKLDREFENVENIILTVFKILKEYDKLMEMAEKEMEKIGGEKLDD